VRRAIPYDHQSGNHHGNCFEAFAERVLDGIGAAMLDLDVMTD